MTFTITWWMIPTFLSVISLVWLIWASHQSRHVFDSIAVLVVGCPVAIVNCVAWVVAALLK